MLRVNDFGKLDIKLLRQILELYNSIEGNEPMILVEGEIWRGMNGINIVPKGTFNKIWYDCQEPCEDTINRQAVLDTTICEGISCNECSFNEIDGECGCLLHKRVAEIPTVRPSRHKESEDANIHINS